MSKPREWWIAELNNGEYDEAWRSNKIFPSVDPVRVIEYLAVCKIPVGDKFAQVDFSDYGLLSRFQWHLKPDKKTFYAQTNVKIGGKNVGVSMHRLVCGLVNSEVDHKNRDGLDNRRENLRFATPQQNQCNRVRKNAVGFRGVAKHGAGFMAQIQVNGKRLHKYGFKTPEEAARAYDELSKEHHGEFGIRNFKD